MTEAERLALITHEQVGFVLKEAELVELAKLEAEENAAIHVRPAKLRDEHDAWRSPSTAKANGRKRCISTG